MPEKTRVFIGVDGAAWQQHYYKRLIESEGHTVVLQAMSKAEALRATRQFPKQHVQVAVLDILDGDLSGMATQSVVHAIREHAPEVKIIKMPGIPLQHTDIDFEISDPNLLPQIGRIITEL